MTTASSPGYPESGGARDTYTAPRTRTETKSAFRTTELFVYAASVIAVLIASLAVGDDAAGVDRFPADQAWLYVTLLTIGYLVSRGLAKSGTREPTDDTRH
ncbi:MULTISPECIES: hypothetical protein [unclassified Streptomyces]|uniref:hypothetical protein n=1 Tax=unclassified Streptomyces TaxID=2593676 RepID=UPI001661D7DA|nr:MULTISPECIES: hypothetical protein [unclassified Streptomyces]MBD0839449.1 hypothetical protein [Streptomyces sp. TRM68416]